MLQIISGKFFKSNKLLVHEGLGIAYSNLRIFQPIKTCIASLEPADYSGSYVIKYTNQIEEEEGERQARLVRTGDTEIVDQFLLLCMFGLRAFFSVDRAEVVANCRASRRHDADRSRPSQYIPRFFDPDILPSPNQAETFQALVAKAMSLKRSQYELTIRYFTALRDALEAINFNVDLAYSMIVYAMEALSQSTTTFEPTWNDYDPQLQHLLEDSFIKIDSAVADEIKTSLLQSSHLRLQQRFVAFITTHLSDAFFTSDAPQVTMGLRPSVLPRALKNAYRMRSNFAHSLTALLDQIRTPIFADSELFFWDAEPYITLRGLLRIAEEVIRVYISRQESVEREDVAWRRELPGIITLEMAPRYWIWKHEGLKPEHATEKLRGLLDHIAEIMRSPGPLPDLGGLMEKYETMMPEAPVHAKRAMAAAYWIYNTMVVSEGRRPGHEKVLEKYQKLLQECSTENLAAHLIVRHELPWPVDAVVKAFRRYQGERYNARNIRIPRPMELAIMTEIAKMYLDASQTEHFDAWMVEAFKEASGLGEWQSDIERCRQNLTPLNWSNLLQNQPKNGEQNAASTDNPTRMADAQEAFQKTQHLAYQLWEKRGRPSWDDLRDWYEALKLISDGAQTPSEQSS